MESTAEQSMLPTNTVLDSKTRELAEVTERLRGKRLFRCVGLFSILDVPCTVDHSLVYCKGTTQSVQIIEELKMG